MALAKSPDWYRVVWLQHMRRVKHGDDAAIQRSTFIYFCTERNDTLFSLSPHSLGSGLLGHPDLDPDPVNKTDKENPVNLFFSLYNNVQNTISAKLFFILNFECHQMIKSDKKMAYKFCLLKIIWEITMQDPVLITIGPDPQHQVNCTLHLNSVQVYRPAV